MSARCRAAFVAATVAIAASGLSIRARPAPPQAAKPRVWLVVVRDSNLLTMCSGPSPVARRGRGVHRPGEQLAVSNVGRMQEFQIPRDTGIEFGSLPVPSTGAPTVSTELGREGIRADLVVKREVEQAFKKLGTYTVVDSMDDADTLFIVESFYTSVSATASALFVRPLTDGPRNLLGALVGIAVDKKPSAERPIPIGALLEQASWEGSALAMVERRANAVIVHPASVESLVRQFCGQEARPSGHPPVCAASNAALAAPALFALAIPHEAGAGARQAGAGQPAGSAGMPSPFSSRAAYVAVPVTVLDPDGSTVSDLHAGDFRVLEDDVDQVIDRVFVPGQSFDIAVMVDTSLSMAWTRQDAEVSLLAFINALRPTDRLLLASFDDRIFVRSELTSDRRELRRGVFELDHGVGTRLYDAVALLVERRLSTLTGRRAMVLITDGRDTTSRLVNAEQILQLVASSEIPIYVVQKEAGPGPAAARSNSLDDRQRETLASAFLSKLADDTGGRIFHVSRQAEIDDAFGEIASELKHQYTITYYPTDQKADGRYRRIRVVVSRPGARVRSRSGYWAVEASVRSTRAR